MKVKKDTRRTQRVYCKPKKGKNEAKVDQMSKNLSRQKPDKTVKKG